MNSAKWSVLVILRTSTCLTIEGSPLIMRFFVRDFLEDFLRLCSAFDGKTTFFILQNPFTKRNKGGLMKTNFSRIFMIVIFTVFSYYSFAILQDELNEEQGWELESSYQKQTHTKKTMKHDSGRDLPEDGLLLIPDSAGDRVMAFDPETGDLYDADFIPSDPANLSTPIQAALHPDENSILVSGQLADGLLQYDLDGNFMNWFAPAGGVNNAILNNVRGWDLKADGSILVCNNGTASANPDCVVEFDASGNHIGNFIANGAGGLDSPFCVLYRPTFDDYLVTASSSDAVHQYDNAGNFIGNLVAGINFPEQVTETASGNLLVAAFSTPSGCYEYTSDGTYVGFYDVVDGLRGVYELPSGNILVTNSDGVFEIDRNNTLVETKISGVNARFIILAKQTSTYVGWIEGNVVLDGGTGNVEDVTVTAGTETVNPDANGDYSIEIEAGTYDVTASLEGYLDEIVVDVIVIEGQITGNIDFTLEWITNPFPPPGWVQVDPYTGILTWGYPGGMIYSDDFESYNVGEYLAVQSDYWTTWSNNPGSAEDAFISDDYALSGTNSVKVDGTTDLVLIMDNYTEGCYSMDLNMYIPAGYCGYYNLQKTNIPGTEWGFQIMFDVTGIASIDGGAAAACVFPFDFDTWMNYEIIVDLDNDLCEFLYDGTLMHSYQWTLGTFGTPGLLQLGGMNMYAWASAGNNPLYYFDDVTFQHVNAEPSDELLGYNIYLDGALVDFVTNPPHQLTGLVIGQIYVAGVSCVYDGGESEIAEVEFTFLGTPINPPENLVATLYDYNDVHLEWEPPCWTGALLTYHTGYDNNGIGTGAAADWMCAARFTADELADFYGSDLTSVNIHIRTADFSYVAVKIWEGGSFGDPGTEVYSADITGSVLIEDWTEHTLTTPIPLVAGNEYWIGYDISATDDHPSSVDAGPAIAGKGDWMFYEGIWQEISVAFGLDYNWCIEGVVGEETDGILTSKPVLQKSRQMFSNGIPEVFATHPHIKGIESNRDSRMLLGFKVYRNGVMLAYIEFPNPLTYDDLGLGAGTYEYWVTAIYDYGESGPSNVEEVTVVLNPPQNVTAVVQGMYNVFLSWDAPATRDLDYYNVYRDSIQIGSNTSTFYLDVGLAAGDYVYNVTAVYDGGWESEFSTNNWVGVDIGNTPIPIVTELIGNYPNPFNPTTIISFSLNTENTEGTEILIYNLKGQKIKQLEIRNLKSVINEVIWNGRDENGKLVSSGIYFYKMKTGKYVSTKRMILLK